MRLQCEQTSDPYPSLHSDRSESHFPSPVPVPVVPLSLGERTGGSVRRHERTHAHTHRKGGHQTGRLPCSAAGADAQGRQTERSGEGGGVVLLAVQHGPPCDAAFHPVGAALVGACLLPTHHTPRRACCACFACARGKAGLAGMLARVRAGHTERGARAPPPRHGRRQARLSLQSTLEFIWTK